MQGKPRVSDLQFDKFIALMKNDDKNRGRVSKIEASELLKEFVNFTDETDQNKIDKSKNSIRKSTLDQSNIVR